MLALVSGCFDPLHHGHLQYLRVAHRYVFRIPARCGTGTKILCAVEPDADLEQRKQRPACLPAKTRAEIIRALGFMDGVEIATAYGVLATHHVDVFLKTVSWRGHLPPEIIEICKERHTIIKYLKLRHVASSTALLDAYCAKRLSRP